MHEKINTITDFPLQNLEVSNFELSRQNFISLIYSHIEYMSKAFLSLLSNVVIYVFFALYPSVFLSSFIPNLLTSSIDGFFRLLFQNLPVIRITRFITLLLRLFLVLVYLTFVNSRRNMSENGEQSNAPAENNQAQGEYIKLKVVGQVSLFSQFLSLFL